MDDAALSHLVADPNPQKGVFGVDPYNGGIFGGPLYPYQYTDESFYDFPKAPYDDGFFSGWAMLSKVDYATRTLTTYEGVSYGFDLHVQNIPEPSSITLVLLGGLLVSLQKMSKAKKPGSG